MVHDFVDDDGANFRIGVRQAGAGAELSDVGGVVHAEGALAHGGEIEADAGLVAAKRDGVFGGTKVKFNAIAGEVAARIGGGEDGVVAFGRIESESSGGVGVSKLVLVEDEIAIGGKRG